ncbi:unnamed protein product [Toxocara canis]|uniref:Secreted protein n=1 Tax=Toxocara canis TaxID=6265 RepID=A0A183UJ39_TOXCA|nr:unnamed protein product [Toxocara canis]
MAHCLCQLCRCDTSSKKCDVSYSKTRLNSTLKAFLSEMLFSRVYGETLCNSFRTIDMATNFDAEPCTFIFIQMYFRPGVQSGGLKDGGVDELR